jgi:hypothetical protein
MTKKKAPITQKNIRLPRTLSELEKVVKEVCSRPNQSKRGWWVHHSFTDILRLLRIKKPKMPKRLSDKLYEKLCVSFYLPLANKIIADRGFHNIDSWDLVEKMWKESFKFGLDKKTSSYSYFYTVGLREAYSLVNLADNQIVPLHMLLREEYPTSLFSPLLAEKEGYVTIQVTKLTNDRTRVLYIPINGIISVHDMYSWDDDLSEEEILSSLPPYEYEDETGILEVPSSIPIIYTEEKSNTYREAEHLTLDSYYEERLGESQKEMLNSLKGAIDKVAPNPDIASKAYMLLCYLLSTPNVATSEQNVWTNFKKEAQLNLNTGEKELIMHVLKKACNLKLISY